MSVRILTGDCRDVLRTLPDGSVQAIVTSPPYWNLRDYGVDGQIGLEGSVDAWVAELVAVFREARRVLADDGVLFLNLGDSYWTSGARQTGQNDSDRETPGGRGGSFRGGARRAIVYGTSGKEPASFPASDCLCGSLCDACRKAYRIGKSHSGSQLDPTLEPSLSESSRAHTESSLGRLPTSDSQPLAGRSGGAILSEQPLQAHEAEPLPASQETTPAGSSPRHPEASRPLVRPSGCQLCGRSLERCAPEFADNSACTCGTEAPLDASGRGTSGISSSDLACRHLTTARLKPKDLIGQPWRVAFALQADGWWWRDTIVWHKPNPMPESVTDRCTKAWEPVLMMTKSARYFFDAEAIKEPASDGTHERYAAAKGQPFGVSNWNRGDGPRDAVSCSAKRTKTPDGWDTSKGGGGHGSFHKEGREKGRKTAPNGSGTKTNASFDAAMAVMPERRNKRNVWTIASEPFKESHFATFPTALVEPCILASTRAGDTVLDPFFGAGTTGLVADRLVRNCIGIELNPEYIEIARRRITGDNPLFAEVA